jgi:hypothetical protein
MTTNTRNINRTARAPRFHVYANMRDGNGVIRQNEQPLLQRSVKPMVDHLMAAGATKEPLVVRA